MTGSMLFAPPSIGTWTVVYDGMTVGRDWSTTAVSWTADEPSDATLTVMVASSPDGSSFGSGVPLLNGAKPSLTGRYLRIAVTFTRATAGASPILYDLTIGSKNCEDTVSWPSIDEGCTNVKRICDETLDECVRCHNDDALGDALYGGKRDTGCWKKKPYCVKNWAEIPANAAGTSCAMCQNTEENESFSKPDLGCPPSAPRCMRTNMKTIPLNSYGNTCGPKACTPCWFIPPAGPNDSVTCQHDNYGDDTCRRPRNYTGTDCYTGMSPCTPIDIVPPKCSAPCQPYISPAQPGDVVTCQHETPGDNTCRRPPNYPSGGCSNGMTLCVPV